MSSLSARRAWIEIFPPIELFDERGVALRKESVDRNRFFWFCLGTRVSSLSARRAWIEITMRRDFKALGLVALRKESVDRNQVVH